MLVGLLKCCNLIDSNKTLKEERGEKRKREAGKDFNWGMLYMNVSFLNSSLLVLNCAYTRVERCRGFFDCR